MTAPSFSWRALLLMTSALTLTNLAAAQETEKTNNTQDKDQPEAESLAPPRLQFKLDLEEVVVQGRYIPDERRATSEIANVLTDIEIARTGDSDIAVSLQRVTGLSLVKGKFVYVRGLGERYSSALLDGAGLPSPEPLQRVVPLDIFPTSLLSGALVQKTYSPEYPGEFGGGVIELRSKAIPDEPFLSLNISSEYNSTTSLKTGQSYDGAGLDFLGFDTGLRSLPATLRANPNLDGLSASEIETIAENIPNRFSLDREDNPLNGGLTVSYGNSWDVGDGRLGLTAVIDYDNSFQNKEGIRRSFAGPALAPRLILSGEGCNEQDFPGNDGRCGFRTTEQTIGLNGIFSVGYELDSANSFKYTTLILRKTTKEAFNSQGLQAENGILRNTSRIDFVEQQVWNQQLSGNHSFSLFGADALDSELNWRAVYAKAFRDVQLRRTYRYNFDESTGGFLFDTSDEGNRTVWGDLTDDNLELGVDFLQPFNVGAIPVDFKAGFTYVDKSRDSQFYRYRYDFTGLRPSPELRALVPEIIFSDVNVGPGGIGFDSVTRLEDTYDASFDNLQGYIQFDAQLNDRLRLSFGGRYEDSKLATNSFNVVGLPSPGLEETKRFLPATTLTYEFIDNMQVRLAYSRTLSRPDLRELSPARFLDDERDIDVRGNPNLVTSKLDNYDARFEWYFGDGEQTTIGFFYKEISDPIEQIFNIVADELQLSFINGESAKLYGVEAEIETYIPIYDAFEWGFFEDRDVFFKANGSWIKSDVTSANVRGQNLITDLKHALQGQSKWLFNAQIGFENLDRGESLALLFNYTDKRISDLGIAGAGNLIEGAFWGLDLVYRRQINLGLPFDLSLAARNLLKDDQIRTQENRAGGADQIVEQYDIGRTVSLSLTYNF